MSTNVDKLAAIRHDAARELYLILTGAYDEGTSPFTNPVIAQFVAIAQAADIAKEVLDEFEKVVPAAFEDAGRNDYNP